MLPAPVVPRLPVASASAAGPSQEDTPVATPPDYSGLRAALVNCTLTPDPSRSHTGRLLDAVESIMTSAGVEVDRIHAVTADLVPGVQPDMREHGWDHDGWPELWPRIEAADILVVGTPIWLGEESSVCRQLIERLYAMSGMLNDAGQSVYYGKTGGAVVTGNEDGVKHVAMSLTFTLSHLGYTVPPQSDAGWIGPIGPGPSYGDPQEDGTGVGFDSDFTRRNTIIMTWNLLHTAHLLRDGFPTYGNDRNALAEGQTFGYVEPEPLPE